MVAQSGSLVLLELYEEVSKDYIVLGGMRTTRFVLNSHLVDTTNKLSGAWREILDQAGMRSVSISGNGMFTDSKAEQIARELAFTSKLANFRISFGNKDKLTGKFLVVSYERIGSYQEEEQYHIILESSGKIGYGHC